MYAYLTVKMFVHLCCCLFTIVRFSSDFLFYFCMFLFLVIIIFVTLFLLRLWSWSLHFFADCGCDCCSCDRVDLAGAWIWVGSGGTNQRQYPLEEQFSGPISSKNTFSKKLRDKFSALKRQGKVEHFSIRDQYPRA